MADALPMPSSWPASSELRFVGRHQHLGQLRSFLGDAQSAPSPSLLELAAQVDAELPLRDAEIERETMRPPCPGCGRCADRRRPTAPRMRPIGGHR